MAALIQEKTRPVVTETLRPDAEPVLASPEITAPAAEAPKEMPAATNTPESTPPPINRLRPARRLTPVIHPVRDALSIKVEKILEEGLSEPFHRLSPLAREEFKMKGEQTATKIGELLKASHVKVKKIFELIIAWLKLLPGINHFFLEQEAKIKTDRIIALHNRV